MNPETHQPPGIPRRDFLFYLRDLAFTAGLASFVSVGPEIARQLNALAEFDPGNPKIVHNNINMPVKEPLVVIQLTDLHYGPYAACNPSTLNSIIKFIKQIFETTNHQTVLCLTGDVINHDGRSNNIGTSLLSSFDAFSRLAKTGADLTVWSPGNHENGNPRVGELYEMIGSLMYAPKDPDSALLIEDSYLPILALPDYTTNKDWFTRPENQRFLVESGKNSLVLCHNAMAYENNPTLTYESLVIAGHSHGGHVANGIFSPLLQRHALNSIGYDSDMVNGVYRRSSNIIAVSPGLGTHPSHPTRTVPAQIDVYHISPN